MLGSRKDQLTASQQIAKTAEGMQPVHFNRQIAKSIVKVAKQAGQLLRTEKSVPIAEAETRISLR
jgi:hypothetical protein